MGFNIGVKIGNTNEVEPEEVSVSFHDVNGVSFDVVFMMLMIPCNCSGSPAQRKIFSQSC